MTVDRLKWIRKTSSYLLTTEEGIIKLNIRCTFTLDEIAEAHRYMESNSPAGNIVVVT